MIISSYHISQPKEGETRILRRWAWWHRVGDKIVVMGRYSVMQVYSFTIYQVSNGKEKKAFRVGQWFDISENINKVDAV